MASVSAEQLRELSERWKNFDVEQERALKEMKSANAADEETIRDLHARIARREEEFKEEWTDLRSQIREDRDAAIKNLVKEGTRQAEVMRIMGNSNSQLLSRLYKEAMLELHEEQASATPATAAKVALSHGSPLDRLREERERQGLTQLELATKMGVSMSVLNKIERGSKGEVKLSTLERMASALGVRLALDVLPDF
ncbi:hypothetical protein GCM10027405_02810 [Arthrobacter alkaliphilus]